MPLFLFKCVTCEIIIEKLSNNIKNLEVICEKCGKKCERQFSIHRNRTELNAKTFYKEKILPDVKRISNELDSEKESTISDICGDN